MNRSYISVIIIILAAVQAAVPQTAAAQSTEDYTATFLGGSDGVQTIYSMAVGADGSVYVTGYTKATDFPATEGAFSTTAAGSRDAFIAKFSADLSTLQAATFFGGSQSDEPRSLAVGADGSIYIAGITGSDDLPGTSGGFQPEHVVGRVGDDGFVARFSADLSTLQAATYLSGSNGGAEDRAYALAVAGDGSVYVAGYTDSPDFPVTDGAYDTTHPADPDVISPPGMVFVAHLSADLSQMLAGTFLGADEGGQSAYSIAVGAAGDVYVAGQTGAADFPVTAGAYDTVLNAGGSYSDLYIARFDADLKQLLSCTFLGGTDSESMGYDRPQQTDRSLAFDADGNIYITGCTSSLDFPVTPGAFGTVREYAGTFVALLNDDLSELIAATYLCNGTSRSIAVDADGSIVVAGDSEYGCPTPVDAIQTEEDDWVSTYVIRLDSDLSGMQAATFFGGSERETALSVVLDTSGRIYTAGKTSSADFPVTAGAYDAGFNGGENHDDAFVAWFPAMLSTGSTTTTVPLDECPLETSGLDETSLSVFRMLRDTRLAKKAPQLCTLYYTHSAAVVRLLASDISLSRRLRSIALKAVPAAAGGTAIPETLLQQAVVFLRDLQAAAGPSLSCDIGRLIKDIDTGRLLESLGITVRKAAHDKQ